VITVMLAVILCDHFSLVSITEDFLSKHNQLERRSR